MNPLFSHSIALACLLSLLSLSTYAGTISATISEVPQYSVTELPEKEGELPTTTGLPIESKGTAAATSKFYGAIAKNVVMSGDKSWDPKTDKFFQEIAKSDAFLKGRHEAILQKNKDGDQKVKGIRITNGEDVYVYVPPAQFLTKLPKKEGDPLYVKLLKKDGTLDPNLYGLTSKEAQRANVDVAKMAGEQSKFFKENASRKKLASYIPGKFFDGSSVAPDKDSTPKADRWKKVRAKGGFLKGDELKIGNTMGSKRPSKTELEAMRKAGKLHYWDGKTLLRFGEGEDTAVGYKAKGEVGRNTKGVLFYHGEAAPEANGSHPDWKKNWAFYGIPKESAGMKGPQFISAYKDLDLSKGITDTVIEKTKLKDGSYATSRRSLDLEKNFVAVKAYDKGGEVAEDVRLVKYKHGAQVTTTGYRDDLGREYRSDGIDKKIVRQWQRTKEVPLPGGEKKVTGDSETVAKKKAGEVADPLEPGDKKKEVVEKETVVPVTKTKEAAVVATGEVEKSLSRARDVISALQQRLTDKFASDSDLGKEIDTLAAGDPNALYFSDKDVSSLQTLATNKEAKPEERNSAIRILTNIAGLGTKPGTAKRRAQIITFMETQLKPDSGVSVSERQTLIAGIKRQAGWHKTESKRVTGILSGYITDAKSGGADVESAASALADLKQYDALGKVLENSTSPGAVAASLALHKRVDASVADASKPAAKISYHGRGRTKRTTPPSAAAVASYEKDQAAREKMRVLSKPMLKILKASWENGSSDEIKQRSATALTRMNNAGGFKLVLDAVKSSKTNDDTVVRSIKALTSEALGTKTSARRKSVNYALYEAMQQDRGPKVRLQASKAMAWQGENNVLLGAPVKLIAALNVEKDPEIRENLGKALAKNFQNPTNAHTVPAGFLRSAVESPKDYRLEKGLGAVRNQALDTLISEARSGNTAVATHIGPMLHAHESDKRLFDLVYLSLSNKFNKEHPKTAEALRGSLGIDRDGNIVQSGINSRYATAAAEKIKTNKYRGRQQYTTGEARYHYLEDLKLFQAKIASMKGTAMNATSVSGNYTANANIEYRRWVALKAKKTTTTSRRGRR